MNYRTLFAIIISLSLASSVSAQPPSLRDKIGQMFIIGFDGKHIDQHAVIVQAINKSNIGGVILFDYHAQHQVPDKNIENPEQLKHLTTQLQTFTQEANNQYHRYPLPLLIGIDFEGGNVNRLKEAYGFPPTISAADIGKLPLSEAQRYAVTMATTLKNVGINLNFAPVLDLNTNPNNPIIGAKDRSFSANPGDVAAYADLYSQQYKQQGILCAYKHFPGHGSSQADSHLGFVDVTDFWQADELEPYQQALNTDSSCGMIMTAHIVNRKLDNAGLPATLSHKILTDLLRHALHFKGVIISDDMQMKAIVDNYGKKQALTLAINAGTDMFIFANQIETYQDPEVLIDMIAAQVTVGEISPERIDESYQRIVALKKTLIHSAEE